MSTSIRTRRHGEAGAHSERWTVRDVGIVAMLVAAVLVATVVSSRGGCRPSDHTQSIRVVQGDTVWQIASDLDIPGTSTADLVGEIVRLNSLEGKNLRAGMEIRVPSEPRLSGAVASR